MKLSGHFRKMHTNLTTPVSYHLPLDGEKIAMNELIGKKLSFTYTGAIHCVACGRKTKKSFQQGYCYPCFQSLAECDSCLIKPELCHYHEGTCREPQWGEQHCFQDHYVYLANSSGIKVGITRQTNLPSRWMDQGATQALPIFRVQDRIMSGRVEVELKKYVNDKTAWQKMLKGEPEPQDLPAARDVLFEKSHPVISKLEKEFGANALTALSNESVVEIKYPVETYPVKVNSFNFDKTPQVSGILQGIKGQYLLLDGGVLNVRKFSGYNIDMQIG